MKIETFPEDGMKGLSLFGVGDYKKRNREAAKEL